MIRFRAVPSQTFSPVMATLGMLGAFTFRQGLLVLVVSIAVVVIWLAIESVSQSLRRCRENMGGWQLIRLYFYCLFLSAIAAALAATVTTAPYLIWPSGALSPGGRGETSNPPTSCVRGNSTSATPFGGEGRSSSSGYQLMVCAPEMRKPPKLT